MCKVSTHGTLIHNALVRHYINLFLTCSILCGAEKFCLGHGLTQLTLDVKSGVRMLNFRSDVTKALPRKTPNDLL